MNLLPVEVWENGRRKRLPPLRTAASNYDYVMYRAAYEITHCLEKWLKVPLDYDQTFLPAALMLNPYEGPVWMHLEQGQEIGDIRKVKNETQRAKKLIERAIQLERAGEQNASNADVDRALFRMRNLPPPVSLWIENANCQTRSEWFELFGHIFTLFSEYAERRKGLSGHQRARTVAIVVRALYELHSDEAISVGVTEGVPEGRFGMCVQEVLSWAGIPVNFYRYAREAQKLARDDHQLKKYIDILLSLIHI